MAGEGALKIKELQYGGFTPDEIEDYRVEATDKLRQGGFSAQEINDYWGVKEPDTTPIKDFVKGNLEKEFSAKEGEKPKEAKSYYDAFQAGLQMSTWGLDLRGKMPDVVLPQDADMGMKIVSGISQIAGDLPDMVAGGFLGSMAAGAAGSVVPVLGTAAGVAAGGFGGSFALPGALRTWLIDGYQKGEIRSSRDFWERVSSASWQGIKDFALGVATFGAGKVVGVSARALGVGERAATMATIGSEIATMTTVGSAMHGQLPEPEDFLVNAIMVGGVHGTAHVTGKLMNNYKATGKLPAETVEAAKADPVVHQELLSQERIEIKGEKLKGEVEGHTFDGLNPVIDKVEMPAETVKVSEVVDGKPKLFNEKIERTEAETKVLSRLGEQIEPEKNVSINDQIGRAVDDLHPFVELTRDMAKGEKLDPYSDPRVLSQTYRQWHGSAARMTKFGTFSFKTGEKTGEPLVNILRDIPGGDKDGFTAYAMARRAIEKSKQGIETGIDVKAAEEVVKTGAKFKDTHKRFVDFQNRVLDYAVEAKLLDKESSKIFKQMNEDYVPFHRVQDFDPFDAGGKGRSLFKQMTGSDRKILDPIDTAYKNMIAIVKAAERNRVHEGIVRLAEEKGGFGEWIKKVETKVKPVKVTEKEMAKALDKMGVDPDVTAESLTIFRPRDHLIKDNEFVVSRLKDGKVVKETYAVNEDIAGALNALDIQPQLTALWQKILLKYPANFLRGSVTLNPAFNIANFVKDQFTAAIQSKTGQKPFVEVLNAVGEMWRKEDGSMYRGGEEFQKFLSDGGASGAFGEIAQFLEKDVWKLNQQTGFLNQTWNLIKTPFQAAGAAFQAIENIPRFNEYRRAGGGKGGAQAAREVTLDFSKGTARTRAINAAVPFFNPAIQGLFKTKEAFHKENINKTMAVATASVTMPSLLLWWSNKDDSRYVNAPNWQKIMYWIIPTDNWVPAITAEDAMNRPPDLRRQVGGKWEVNNGVTYRIMKPPGWGQIFGSLPEMVFDSFYNEHGRDRKTGASYFDHMTELMGQVASVGGVPTGPLPMAEQFTNKNFFTGNQIVPSHLEDEAPQYQYNQYTSELAKQLGKIIGAVPVLRDLGPKNARLSSPMVIDNYIKDWTSGLGDYVVYGLDKALSKAKQKETNVEMPAESLASVPFFKSFIVRNPTMQAAEVQTFYDNYREFSGLKSAAKKVFKESMQAGSEAQFNEAQSIMAENKEAIVLVEGARKALKQQNIAIQKIMASDFKPEEKQQLIDGITWKMIEISRLGNLTIKQIKERKEGGL